MAGPVYGEPDSGVGIGNGGGFGGMGLLVPKWLHGQYSTHRQKLTLQL